jgi:cytochrome c-type biogenesis protein CcmH/NrfF
VWIIPVLVAVLAVGVLSSSFKKWRSGRGKLVTDEDRELVRKLRDEP